MNANGFVIEKNEGFNTNINGHISDLLQKSKKILKSDNINSIEILFENNICQTAYVVLLTVKL